MQQHVATRRDVIGLGVFDLVVADAVLAGDEDHPRRRQPRHVDRVVACARDHRHVAVAQRCRSPRHRLHAVGMEGLGGVGRHGGDLDRQPALGAEQGRHRADVGVHRLAEFVAGIAQVDAELDPARNHVAAVRMHVDHAHRATAMRGVAVGAGHHLLHQFGGHLQRVAAQRHRRRAGMCFHAGDHAVVPAYAQHAGDHADRDVVVLEHRPLLDMGLEIAADRMVAGLLLADVADALEFALDGLAIGIGRGISVFQRESLGEHARSHHHRHEARAFLVGPPSHLDRRLGRDAGVVEGSHHLDAGEHTVVAVELAARGLGVDVAAGHHRRQCIVAAGPAQEAVANLVDGHRHAGFDRPAADQVAALLVQVGQGQAADAALGRGADLREFHQRVPQPGAIDAQVLQFRRR